MSDFFSVVFVSLGRVIQHILEKPAHGPFLADFTCMASLLSFYTHGFTDEFLHTPDDVIPGGKWLGVESPIAIFCLCLPSIFALVKKGIDDGPPAIFLLSRRRLSVQSHTDRVTILRQASDDGDMIDDRNLYALPRRAPGMSAASNATAFGEYSSSDASRKTVGVTVHDPHVIHVQTEISVETRSTWVDLIGVDI